MGKPLYLSDMFFSKEDNFCNFLYASLSGKRSTLQYTVLLFIGYHNPVMQQSSEREITHVMFLISLLGS